MTPESSWKCGCLRASKELFQNGEAICAHHFYRLQLNPATTEFILFGARRNLAKLSDNCRAITVCSSVIQLFC